MTLTVPADAGFLAFYKGRDNKWRVARNALGTPIVCETEYLAMCVARYRRRRLKIWR